MLKHLTKVFGDYGEKQALKLLQKHGLKLLQKNYRTRFGEIDIIMQDKIEVVFVEVRYRKNSNICHPVQTVDAKKRRRLIKNALHYSQRNDPQARMRFDVVGIQKSAPPTWIRNAFSAD